MSKFTAKWKYSTNGIEIERVIDTDEVYHAGDYRPPDRPATSEKLGVYDIPPGGIVILGNPYNGADSMALTFGKVYIVNGGGQTVARYTLADVPPWEGLAQEHMAQRNGSVSDGKQ